MSEEVPFLHLRNASVLYISYTCSVVLASVMLGCALRSNQVATYGRVLTFFLLESMMQYCNTTTKYAIKLVCDS